MRKQLKEAHGLIERTQDILRKVSCDIKIPTPIRNKATKIIEALDIDKEELRRMREHT